MALSNVRDFTPHVISTCDSKHGGTGPHNNGNGRDCAYGVDSENYSTNTVEHNVTVTGGS